VGNAISLERIQESDEYADNSTMSAIGVDIVEISDSLTDKCGRVLKIIRVSEV
jgi:hypothetical protein